MSNARAGLLGLSLLVVALAPRMARGADLGTVPQHGVYELRLAGPRLSAADAPARDVELFVTFRHESGKPELRLPGFWDGDGKGGPEGDVFAVRFCPTKPGKWTVVRTESNRPELRGRREGDTLACTPSKHPGFWVPDGRWYKRSADGSHPFVVGNTHYSFLSRRNDQGPVKTDPVEDVRRNAEYFGKLRFTLMSDRYPDPDDTPFLDDAGEPSDDGKYSFRPNPRWFRTRADPVIAEAHRVDLACDLILCGPDTRDSRSTLRDEAGARAGLSYVAARYGAYPNVWFCLSNEYDIRDPAYTPAQVVRAGVYLRGRLAYPNPVSVHRDAGDWNPALNGAWHDHVIFQGKIKTLDEAADAAVRNFGIGGGDKPVVNDENAYQGDGDGFSEADTAEGCFGTFLGGAYATTGEKYSEKLGQYFWGGFDESAHTAARGLRYLREYVNRSVPFWTMQPLPLADTPFAGIGVRARVLGRAGEGYVLGTSGRGEHRVELPPGRWDVVQVDLMSRTTRTLAEGAAGTFSFATPDSRAVLTHFARRQQDG